MQSDDDTDEFTAAVRDATPPDRDAIPNPFSVPRSAPWKPVQPTLTPKVDPLQWLDFKAYLAHASGSQLGVSLDVDENVMQLALDLTSSSLLAAAQQLVQTCSPTSLVAFRTQLHQLYLTPARTARRAPKVPLSLEIIGLAQRGLAALQEVIEDRAQGK